MSIMIPARDVMTWSSHGGRLPRPWGPARPLGWSFLGGDGRRLVIELPGLPRDLELRPAVVSVSGLRPRTVHLLPNRVKGAGRGHGNDHANRGRPGRAQGGGKVRN